MMAPTRVRNFLRRQLSSWYRTRPARIEPDEPVVSFTFDDFPVTAYTVGGALLERSGLNATYYTAFGLMGKFDIEIGQCFDREHVIELLRRGHELGCHTYSHCHAWDTKPAAFRRDLEQNRHAARTEFPGAELRSLSYPISVPRPGNKRVASAYYPCCRGGGQTFARGEVDANALPAFFLEKTGGNLSAVKRVLEENLQARGWLIFATHDLDEKPTPYGCIPSFFARVVDAALASGARILPVAKAWDIVRTRH